MSITVIVPCYNHGHYVGAALDGIFMQTRLADEVIVIDDASTDDSAEVIARYVGAHSNLVFIRRTENAGVVAATNQGLAIAKGEFVAFLAADDYVYPGFLETLSDVMRSHPEAAFASASVRLRDSTGRVLGDRPILRPSRRRAFLPPARVRAILTKGDNFFLGPASLYRKSCLTALGGFEGALGSTSDGIMQRRLAVRYGMYFIPEILAVWRIHGANYSTGSTTDPRILDTMLAVARDRLDAEPNGLFPAGYAETLARRLRFNAGRLIAGDLARDPARVETLADVVGAGNGSRKALRLFARTGRFAPLVVTAAIALAMRPFSFVWLLEEWIARALVPIPDRNGPEDVFARSIRAGDAPSPGARSPVRGAGIRVR